MNPYSRRAARLHALSARGGALTASTWTAGLQLWSPSSIAFRAAGDGTLIDAVNVGLLVLCAIGWTDLIWHDLRGRLLLPSFNPYLRHRICVGLFSALAAGFGIRAFIASGRDLTTLLTVGGYYLIFAGWVWVEAKALVAEERKPSEKDDTP